MEHLPIACILEFLLAMDSELSHRYLRIRNRITKCVFVLNTLHDSNSLDANAVQL